MSHQFLCHQLTCNHRDRDPSSSLPSQLVLFPGSLTFTLRLRQLAHSFPRIHLLAYSIATAGQFFDNLGLGSILYEFPDVAAHI
ncbi:hypothetical protein KEM48_009455 [Puccinia striiformis f. sp. tritici PST-130]|nr:hypothetical protein KEM48_009455 [Puccinia striiformis f. sp. tritici PST-130]